MASPTTTTATASPTTLTETGRQTSSTTTRTATGSLTRISHRRDRGRAEVRAAPATAFGDAPADRVRRAHDPRHRRAVLLRLGPCLLVLPLLRRGLRGAGAQPVGLPDAQRRRVVPPAGRAGGPRA